MRNLIKTALSVLALLGTAAIASGCEDEHDLCPELCERTLECPEVHGDEDACLTKCSDEQESAEEAECESEWASYIECASHSTNLCDKPALEEECSVQGDAYYGCK